MLVNKNGFSLIEMLIALLLGSTVLVMVIGIYVTSIANGARSLQTSRLRADLQSIMYMIETDIRRAGAGGRAFMVGSGASKTVDTFNDGARSCIVYYYNHDHSNTISSANKMGIRFNVAKREIQFGSNVDPLAANCYQSGHWKALSDRKFIKITLLRFTESAVSNAVATTRSVEIEIHGELSSENAAKHSLVTKIGVRNFEFD